MNRRFGGSDTLPGLIRGTSFPSPRNRPDCKEPWAPPARLEGQRPQVAGSGRLALGEKPCGTAAAEVSGALPPPPEGKGFQQGLAWVMKYGLYLRAKPCCRAPWECERGGEKWKSDSLKLMFSQSLSRQPYLLSFLGWISRA
jgi:hypothetical protein